MSNQHLLVTTHRPAAHLELLHFFGERYGLYGVHAFSSARAWPAAAEPGRLNHPILDRQPAGLTCWIVDQPRVADLVAKLRKVEPSAILHAPLLGLPAASSPLEEYQAVVNETLVWLEAARQACPRVPFVHLSSSLVYGDRANTIAMAPRGDRFEFTDPAYVDGLTEEFPIEGSTHSLLGAAAVAADVLAQEYARSYHLPVCCLRVDSICDPGNGPADRRDVLSQMVHCCLTGTEYVVHGHRGRQVREVLSIRDLALLIEAVIEEPRPGEIYNVGGGKAGSCSIEEMMKWIETVAGKPLRRTYRDVPPLGEPNCYYSNPRHLRDHFPEWQITEPWKELARRTVETLAKPPAR
jgi:CDP-paratose 2-epimerase